MFNRSRRASRMSAKHARAVRLSLRSRRGIALFISMFFVAGIGALALSAIYLTANASLLAKTYEKEDDLKYASEAALQIGKAELNFNPAALPNTSYVQVLNNTTLKAADGANVPGVVVNLFAGPSGLTSGQFGRFASIVSEARDPNGTGFVRRLELTQESFAKYAYWSNNENNASGGTIVFANGDALWGPVWSNDTITIDNTGATFHDDVGTAAPLIVNPSHGTFFKGYQVKQHPITLPSLTTLSTMSALATASNYNITLAPAYTGAESGVLARIEFVATDLNTDGDSTDDNEGFFRVYMATSGNSDWLRADWPGLTTDALNCGDWHTITVNGVDKSEFFPVAAHRYSWFQTLLTNAKTTALVGGAAWSSGAASTEGGLSQALIMGHPGARCYLGGDPHLVSVSRQYGLAAAQGLHERRRRHDLHGDRSVRIVEDVVGDSRVGAGGQGRLEYGGELHVAVVSRLQQQHQGRDLRERHRRRQRSDTRRQHALHAEHHRGSRRSPLRE